MLHIDSLVKQFTLGDETITAVNHVSFDVASGEFIAIIGPSGSGKSTLMNILGLLDRADEGVYAFDDKDVTQLSENEQATIRNEKIGFVFQSFYLLQKLTALENVMVPLLYRGVGEREARERAIKMLGRLKMEDRRNHMPQQLSGGQQQRVAIARALVNDPVIILADEATGNLDTRTSYEVLELFQELHKRGKTIIFVTHNPELAQFSSRTITLRDGHITSDVLNGNIASAKDVLAKMPKNDEQD